MKEKYVLKCFVTFLKRNNAFEEFSERLKKYRDNKSIIQFLKTHCKHQPTEIIINAFPWTRIRGISWAKLHVEWKNECQKKNFKSKI